MRQQQRAGEEIRGLIEDPWLVLPCDDLGDGCRVEFEDSEFTRLARETVYYVRAIQEPSQAVSADPLRCERDESGRCVSARPCYASGPDFEPTDECLASVAERAWSSPIFVLPASGR